MSKFDKIRIVRLEDVLPRFHGNAPSSQITPSGNPAPSGDPAPKPFTPAKEFLPKVEEVTFSLINHLAARGEK